MNRTLWGKHDVAMVYTEWDILQRVPAPIRPANDAARLLLRSQAGRAEKEMTHGYQY